MLNHSQIIQFIKMMKEKKDILLDIRKMRTGNKLTQVHYRDIYYGIKKH